VAYYRLITNYKNVRNWLFELFEMGEAVGIIATFIVVLYYSRKESQKLSVDIESKILNDLDDKMHNLSEITISSPELGEIFDRSAGSQSAKQACAMYALNVFAHAFHMHQRGILRENEWNGWIRTIRSTFRKGTIGDYWSTSELETLLDPEFQDFINNEIFGKDKPKAGNSVKE
jgi:hypothetical protein